MERDDLIEAGMILASELSLAAVLRRIIELAAEITGARYGALGVISEGRLVDFITVGISDEERAAIGDLPVGHGILGLLIHRGIERTPVRIADITRHPQSHGFPPDHPPMKSFLGAPIVARGEVFGDIYLTEKQGANEFSGEDDDAILVLAAQAGIAIENARLYEEVQRRARWLDAVRDITSTVLVGVALEEALEVVARHARALVDADLATVATPTGMSELEIGAADGIGAADVVGIRFPRAASISGAVMATGQGEIVSDVTADDRSAQPIVRLGAMGVAAFVPLGSAEAVVGALCVANVRGRPTFSPADVRLLEAFAGQAGLALEYARAQREVERLAVLEDRERIAKELHDGVIQALFAVGMGLQGAALVSRETDIAARIEGSVDEIDHVIRDLRNYIFGLRPGILADRELDTALRSLVEEFGDKSGVTTVLEVDATVAQELSDVASDVVQLTREALSNVGRHAGATTCRVSLRRRGEVAVIEVDDDGQGFDVATVHRGDGLTNLEQRASALGGGVTLESSSTDGTTVRLEVPL